MDWRIYYDDGSTFDSGMGAPQDAPSYGVVAICTKDESLGRMVVNGFDFYCFQTESEEWFGCDQWGMVDKLLHNMPFSAWKMGRTVRTEEFNRIIAAACSDPDFPPKSGRSRRERPQQVVG